MDEIAATNKVLPVKVLEALYKSDILTLRAERDIIVSIRCPFDLSDVGSTLGFPGGDSGLLESLVDTKIQSISTEGTGRYPDLIIEIENGAEVRARPQNAGEEMWLVDVPGVAFVTP